MVYQSVFLLHSSNLRYFESISTSISGKPTEYSTRALITLQQVNTSLPCLSNSASSDFLTIDRSAPMQYRSQRHEHLLQFFGNFSLYSGQEREGLGSVQINSVIWHVEQNWKVLRSVSRSEALGRLNRYFPITELFSDVRKVYVGGSYGKTTESEYEINETLSTRKNKQEVLSLLNIIFILSIIQQKYLIQIKVIVEDAKHNIHRLIFIFISNTLLWLISLSLSLQRQNILISLISYDHYQQIIKYYSMIEQSTPKEQQLQNKPKKDKVQQKQKKPVKYHNPNFRIDRELIQSLIFKVIKVELLQDLKACLSRNDKRRDLSNLLKEYLHEQKNLNDAAKFSHDILADLTYKSEEPRVPASFVTNFLHILIDKKSKISKLLNKKQGQNLAFRIPLEHITQVIQLYDVKLTKKQANSIFDELALSKSAIRKIPEFIKKTGFDFEHKLINVARQLVKQKQYKTLRQLPNIRQLFKQNQVLRQQKQNMLVATARYILKEEGLEHLEDIFQFYPDVIAKVLNFNDKKIKSYSELVGLCARNKKVLNQLRPDLKQKVLSEQSSMKTQNIQPSNNSVRTNQFAPSNSEQFISFSQFKIKRQDVIWIDSNVNPEQFSKIRQSLLSAIEIGFDTQSVIARTPIDEDIDNLALIQVATQSSLYLFDPENFKYEGITQLFKDILSNPKTTIIGHTVENDVRLLAKFFKIQAIKCKIIDIRSQYEKIRDKEVNRKVGLAAISKVILGKEICKKYCMTNWERRPLNDCQVHYAAMDAYIVLKIWEKMAKLIIENQENRQKAKKNKQLENGKTELNKQ